MLLESVWEYHFDPQTNVVDVQISRLRQKIDKGFFTTGNNKANWIEAVVDRNGSQTREKAGVLRIYFAAGAYCQISNAAEIALAAELLGRLGAKR